MGIGSKPMPDRNVVQITPFMHVADVDVRDLDPIVETLKPKLDTLAAGDVHGPVDQPYRQRELMIRAPDGNLVVFGQPLPPRRRS